jgi:hypothetical protein
MKSDYDFEEDAFVWLIQDSRPVEVLTIRINRIKIDAIRFDRRGYNSVQLIMHFRVIIRDLVVPRSIIQDDIAPPTVRAAQNLSHRAWLLNTSNRSGAAV